ncbi:uncharacterized protein V6R79_006695 [Siganus canaliculatus]
MELQVARNVVAGAKTLTADELLCWLNKTLCTSYSKMDELRTGEAYCQLMHALFPGSMNMSEVRFDGDNAEKSKHNFTLLEGVFRKVGVVRYIPFNPLSEGNWLVTRVFLDWFRLFFEKNIGIKDFPGRKDKGGPVQDQRQTDGQDSGGQDSDASVQEEDASGSSAVTLFIRKYCHNPTLKAGAPLPAPLPDLVLGPDHPQDIIRACRRTPYCLYLYMGVELGRGQSTSVVLIGCYNQASGGRVVRLLLTLQMSADGAEPPAAAGTRAEADARLLVKALQRVGLTLSNLVAFYCNAPEPAVSQLFESKLRPFSPSLISLCRLPTMAGSACEAGIRASFGYVADLIQDIHRHFSTCSSTNDALKALFANSKSYEPSRPVSVQSLFIATTLQRMISSWGDVSDYFQSLRPASDTDRIKRQLMDRKVQLDLLFLSCALQPLLALQVQQQGEVDLVVQLQLTSVLLHSYAASILPPPVTEELLRKRSMRVLDGDKQLLSAAELRARITAGNSLLSKAVADLDQRESGVFLQAAVTFYKAVLISLMESVPEQFGDVALKNMSKFLKSPAVMPSDSASGLVVADLAAQLGVCKIRSPEMQQLFQHYERVSKSWTGSGGHSWEKMLAALRPCPALLRLFLVLLALPSSLHRTQVFTKAFEEPSPLHSGSPEPSPQPRGQTHNKPRKRPAVPRRRAKKTKVQQDKSSSSSEDEQRLPAPSIRHIMKSDDESVTDNSSDVVEVTEETKRHHSNSLTSAQIVQSSPVSEFIYILSSDDDTRPPPPSSPPPRSLPPRSPPPRSPPPRSPPPPPAVELQGLTGELVWVEVEGFSLWPAIISSCEGLPPGTRTVEWYGQTTTSKVTLQALRPFADFSKNFCSKSFTIHSPYRKGIFSCLQEAAQRCKKLFSEHVEDPDDLLKDMLDWAFGGFQPTGPEGFKPVPASHGVKQTTSRSQVNKKLFPKARSSQPTEVQKKPRQKKKSSVAVERCDGSTPPGATLSRRKAYSKMFNKAPERSSVYTQPDQRLRDETLRRIMAENLDIDGFCLCCGTEDTVICHPLFKGSLCQKCKDNFTETLYRYDEDGYQSYCTICCYGLEVILCGNDSCCRSYCEDCLNILVGPGTFDALKVLDPWICYLCQPHETHGALFPRADWSIRVQELFANNSAMAFEPHRVYPSIPASQRRPLRVLSLFDGIATGFLVLKELGFKVETYVASEVCEDSVAVATISHDGKIFHVGDVRSITEEQINKWGPFDLLIGGSPCNDLSIVNPIRKGLYEGTGRLFFEFYRVLQMLKPRDEDPRPFFWLFENVVFMNTHDKVNICRFLECNPVLVDAVKVSPAHRARYFWGNIPGMSRPIIASQSDKLNLQDCLEIGRKARVNKVRTITTNPNSLKQGKDVSLLPVLDNGREDNLWITELEKIFGFPKHYTDVRNMNRQQRQKVLGKAWSVPVIRHLFAPLKDYFACEELPAAASSSCTSSSASSTSPSSPAAPELPDPASV